MYRRQKWFQSLSMSGWFGGMSGTVVLEVKAKKRSSPGLLSFIIVSC